MAKLILIAACTLISCYAMMPGMVQDQGWGLQSNNALGNGPPAGAGKSAMQATDMRFEMGRSPLVNPQGMNNNLVQSRPMLNPVGPGVATPPRVVYGFLNDQVSVGQPVAGAGFQRDMSPGAFQHQPHAASFSQPNMAQPTPQQNMMAAEALMALATSSGQPKSAGIKHPNGKAECDEFGNPVRAGMGRPIPINIDMGNPSKKMTPSPLVWNEKIANDQLWSVAKPVEGLPVNDPSGPIPNSNSTLPPNVTSAPIKVDTKRGKKTNSTKPFRNSQDPIIDNSASNSSSLPKNITQSITQTGDLQGENSTDVRDSNIPRNNGTNSTDVGNSANPTNNGTSAPYSATKQDTVGDLIRWLGGEDPTTAPTNEGAAVSEEAASDVSVGELISWLKSQGNSVPPQPETVKPEPKEHVGEDGQVSIRDLIKWLSSKTGSGKGKHKKGLKSNHGSNLNSKSVSNTSASRP